MVAHMAADKDDVQCGCGHRRSDQAISGKLSLEQLKRLLFPL
jgi:hypothetical protein